MLTDNEVLEMRNRIQSIKDKLHFKYTIALEDQYKQMSHLSPKSKKEYNEIYTNNKKKK